MRVIYYRVLLPSDDCLLYLAYPLTVSIASCSTTVDVGSLPSGVGVLLLSVAVGTEGDVGCVDGCTDEDRVCVLDTVSDAEGEVDGTHERHGLGRGAG
jgi:hypothetical protein